MLCSKCGVIIGNNVKVCPNCNSSIENPSSNNSNNSKKSSVRLPAGLLCMLLGAFGAHRFYLGYKKTAVIMLGLTLISLGVFAIACLGNMFLNDLLITITSLCLALSSLCSFIVSIWVFVDFMRITMNKLPPTSTSRAFRRLNK